MDNEDRTGGVSLARMIIVVALLDIAFVATFLYFVWVA